MSCAAACAAADVDDDHNDSSADRVDERASFSLQLKQPTEAMTTGQDQPFDLTMSSTWAEGFAHISIRPPEAVGVRAPCDICCVVDVSGSMSATVEIQGAAGKERTGLSQLDLVKHALKTIIYSLTENDRLSVVSFESTAAVLFELRSMDEAGRTKSVEELEKLRASGSTNLWDGLTTGLDVLGKGQRATGSNAALFLLTDGDPSDHPPEGYLPAMAAYKAKTNFTCSVNTFGFGYSLKSELLEDLAQMGNSGSFAFIPDGSFVGTIFVNAISNLLTSVATNINLTIGGVNPPVDASSDYLRHYSAETALDKSLEMSEVRVHLGSVVFGQSRDIVVPIDEKQYNKLRLELAYQSAHGAKNKQCTEAIKLPVNMQVFRRQKHRLEFVYHVRSGYTLLTDGPDQATNNQKTIADNLQTLANAIQSHATDDQYLTDLHTDLTGQVKEAFSRMDWFRKWGTHYLLSITRAHLLQQCNNFKDPGVQHYGRGELFSAVRDEMDDIFCGLPAPVGPAVANYDGSGASTPIDMSAFNNANNPCFHGSCVAKLLDGSLKLVKDVLPGDRLYPHGATVTYVLRTAIPNQQACLALLDGGLMITPWHPIRVAGTRWMFPCKLVTSLTSVPCDAVYSFALTEGHTMWINDVECVTLGHGFADDVVRHAYFGGDRVLEDLRVLNGELSCTGVVEIEPSWMVRNKRTGRVCAIRQPAVVNVDAVQ